MAILPISAKFNAYPQPVRKQPQEQDVRAYVDDRSEKIGRKIRDNELKNVPYLINVGEKEQAESTVSVRKQGEGDQGSRKINDFAKKICEEVDEMTKNY